MNRFLLTLIITLATVLTALGQSVAIKNNLAYDALLTPNLSLEAKLANRWTLDLQGGANFFFYTKDPTSSRYKTTKWSHWMVQPEARYWFCEVFDGWFLGLHAQGGAINIGGVSIPFILENKNQVMKDNRYEAWFYGGGLSAGYQLMLSRHWSLEFELGAGYNRIHYDKFPCVQCGSKIAEGTANYVGPTKAAISIVYIIK
ncbi:DUF3575 domain-containing protein [Porphyromonas asaccharolytica]